MNFQVSDEKWYVPLEKFPNEIYENKDETIFRCRKKVWIGLLLIFYRLKNY